MKIMFDLRGLDSHDQRKRLGKEFRNLGIETVERPPPKRRSRAGAGTPNAADRKTTTGSPKNKQSPSRRQAQAAFDLFAPRGAR